MKFLKEMWAVLITAAAAWLSRIDNQELSKIVNLLTILVILIGLTDWAFRRRRGAAEKKKQENRRQVLDTIEGTQQSFKTVNMLEDPMGTSEKIGNFVDKISKRIGEGKMKKFFKWVWYNKEQLFAIAYNVALLALSQLAIWTDAVMALMPALPPAGAIAVKVIIGVLSVGFTALTVRNVCVKYGLSSLDTIDQVLAEKAAEAANKLTPEQKKTIKSYIATLQTTLDKARTDLATAEKALAEITALFNADSTLVANYSGRKAELAREIDRSNAVIANVEGKIAEYKAQLSGKNVKTN